MITLSKSIHDMVSGLLKKKAEIKEEYIKAWLCSVIKDESQIDYVLQNCYMVEKTWHENHKICVSYHMEMKDTCSAPTQNKTGALK